MREALFVKQNSEKWKRYESMQTQNPDDLANRFIDITNDLAYAKTFYPKSKTTDYLNGIASTLHQSIYKNKKEESGRFIRFWKLELPLLFYQYRKQLLYALIFFIVACAIGVLSAKYDHSFLRMFFGDGYVNMTKENIAKGDPFGVYKQQKEFEMFLLIAQNNLKVIVFEVVSGIFFSLGTVYCLLRNGIMLGAFQYFFFSQDLGAQSVLVIWIHGTLEISCIIIAGGAGLVLGNGLLFPKTYSRYASFIKHAKDAVKIVVGLFPIIILAAFFEGFITRHTEMPLWLSISILSLSLIFILFYVIFYPIKIYKRSLNLN
jgi:uncharacterized membrane protein SpoIIM required for sporulation